MKFVPLRLAGAYLIEQDRREDERGFFARVSCEREFAAAGLPARFLQVNNSLSTHPHTMRGLHYQLPPAAETKLVRCIRGCLFDAIVDLRPDSPTFLKWEGAELTADNRRMMYVPEGFAHGFLTLAPDTEALYFVSQFYAPASERGLRWNDPIHGIVWPHPPKVISDKDQHHRDFDRSYHLP